MIGEFPLKVPYFSRHGHRCITADSTKWAYIPIHKNASSNGREFFVNTCGWNLEYDWCEINASGHVNDTTKTKDKQFLIFMREPISRWISGVSEYFNILGKPLDEGMYDLLVDGCSFDTHTEPQSSFLSELEYKHCKVIMMDEHFVPNLQSFVEGELGADFSKFNMLPDIVSAEERSMRSELKGQLLNNPQYLNKLKFHLFGDYYLLNRFNINLKPWHEYK